MEQFEDPGDISWMSELAGRFIVFDGPDGSGKTTQFRRMVRLARDVAGLGVCDVREPGGTAVGERIREILLDPVHEEMDIRAEMLLYMASRAQLVAQRIRPALGRGELVLADRFVSSTLAYQGAAGGLSEAEIVAVAESACGPKRGGTWPDLVVIFDVDEATAASRLNPLLDRMEQKGAAFHRKVRDGYLAQAGADPERHLVINASKGEEAVSESLLRELRNRLAPGAAAGSAA